jgi:uncharacterized membrane protein
VSDLTVSALLVAALAGVFVYVFVRTRGPRRTEAVVPAVPADPPAS